MKTCPLHLTTAFLCSAAAFSVGAFVQPTREALPNLDRRQANAEAAPGQALAGLRTEATATLLARLPRVRVDFDPITRSPMMVSAIDDLLSGPDGAGKALLSVSALGTGEPHRATRAFLAEHSGLFGYGPEALEQARIKREFVTPHNQLRTVVWEQQVDGIPVFEGVLISHTSAKGELVNVGSTFVRNPYQAADLGTPNRSSLMAAPILSAAEAVRVAAESAGEEAASDMITPVSDPETGPEKIQRFTASCLLGEAEARLSYLPLDELSLRLCWDILLTSRSRSEMFRVLVDAQTGEVWLRRCLTEYLSDASYTVFTSDSPSPFSPGHSTPSSTQPGVAARTVVTLSALSTNASPLGWITDGANETIGNNVDAHTDRNYDNYPDLPRPQGSPFRTFNFPLDLAQAPSTYTNAAVVQLFYLCNWMHDKLYELGFTEAAGNFQSNNFGRGGYGNDALQADAQDGSGTDNANMSTPTDGYAPRMQMLTFVGPAPDRDGDLDAEIVLHEYTHGLSNRRVGGGAGLSAS